MDSFAEVIRGITNKGSSRPMAVVPNVDLLSTGNIINVRNATASRVLQKAAEKSEKAFNSALNNYFKKFGLKYKNGKLSSPSIDKAIERSAKKVSKGGSTQTLSDVVRIIKTLNGINSGATINGTNIPSTDPLQSGVVTDIRNIAGGQ